MAKKNLNEVFIKGINDNRLSFYKTAKALLKNEDDVEDALQDALETAYKNIETLKEEKYFKTWMTRIIINKCYDILRKKSKIIPFESEYVENIQEKSNFDEGIEMKMILDKLDNDLKEIVILYYYNDFKQDEIAKIFDLKSIAESNYMYISNARQIALLNNCIDIIGDIDNSVKNNELVDMIEIDVKKLWETLSEITGEVSSDDLLDEIFSKFCLGK